MLYVIRHGKTDWNEKKITMGRKDIPLNEEGVKQAEVSKKILDDYDIDLIICSPLQRAKQTAEIVNRDKMVNIMFDDRLVERCLGQLEGKEYTSDNEIIWDIKTNTSAYGVECMEDFKERVYSFLNDFIQLYQDRNVLLVTHGGVTALINCYFNNCLYDESISNKFLSNCSIASYECKKHILQLKR